MTGDNDGAGRPESLDRDGADHFVPSRHPTPGPRGARFVWTGEASAPLKEGEPATAADVKHPTVSAGLFGAYPPTAADRRRPRVRDRMLGIDAARGFALLGMFAVHILPAYNPSAGRASIVWLVFAGTASSLFGVLAGVGLAFSTGATERYAGRRFYRALVQIAFRAIVLLAIGMTVNMVRLTVFNILVYFAAVFLVALPLLSIPAKPLLAISGVLLVVMPVGRYLIHKLVVDVGYYPNPTFSNVAEDPLGVLSTLYITGVYPGATWLVFICFGIAIGRLGITRLREVLLVVGAAVFAASWALSWLVVRTTRGYEAVQSAFPGASEDEVDDFIVFGPTGQLPTGSPGWLLVGGPHTETPFALAIGIGSAVAAIGVFIILARHATKALRPLIDAGALSATIYISHLLLLALVRDGLSIWVLFTIQIVVALGFAFLWRRAFSQGPVEYVISHAARAAGRILVPDRPSKQE